MPDAYEQLRDRVLLMKAEANRVMRSASLLRTQAAQLLDDLDSTAASTSTAEEAHENGSSNRD